MDHDGEGTALKADYEAPALRKLGTVESWTKEVIITPPSPGGGIIVSVHIP